MMYPLLTDFLFESISDIPKEPYKLLKLIIENFPKTIVQNGEQRGKTLSAAVGCYGRDILGEKGAKTTVFKNNGSDIMPLIENGRLAENDGIIYPFGIVDNLVSTDGFSADLLSFDGKVGLCEKESFIIIFAALGDFTVSHFSGTLRLKPGCMLFVPADFRVEILGEGKLIIAHT